VDKRPIFVTSRPWCGISGMSSESGFVFRGCSVQIHGKGDGRASGDSSTEYVQA